MCLIAARTFAGRFVVAAAVILFWATRIGSAQLVSVSHSLLGYEHDAYQPFPGNELALVTLSAGTVPRRTEELRYPQLARTPIDPIDPGSQSLQRMLRPLPTETEQEIPSRTAKVSFDGIDVNAAYAGINHSFFRSARQTRDRIPDDANADDTGVGEPYHWRGLIAQSLFFNVIENSFRSASDNQIRNLLAHKPFWHDYAASMRQFNMRRWNDGDDFLVNYVGHPMQGAVSGFIEVQNDPNGRLQEISATRAYWKSRFKAFLWATAYSTHSEISPLGEAGIGNEGGWTYPIHCHTICTAPGTYTRYTNNTGWVDFIITPTLGTLWLTEHAIISSSIRNSRAPSEMSVSHTVTTVMLSNDYKFSRSIAWRSSFGINLVRYRNPLRTPPGIGNPPYLSFLSLDSYSNKSTYSLEMGPLFHF
jgi:hypothetical protein